MDPLPPVVVDLLSRPNPSVVATLRRDGSPVSAPVWYLWDDGEVLMTMSAASPRRRQLERDPRLTLTVLDAATWYRQVTLHGEVVDLTIDDDLSIIDRLSQHYDGRDYPERTRPGVTARIRVTGWNAFGVDLG